jgi:hypothetical protein
MHEQSAREPLLDEEKRGSVENEQVQDGIHEQNDGKFLCGVFRTYHTSVIGCASHFL